MDPRPFPLDFNLLRRGDYLTPEQVEDATLTTRSSVDYRVAMLQLRDQILAHFLGLGDVVTVVTEKDGLRILTHAEQAEYAPTREQRAVRQLLISHAEGKAVDVSQLTDEQRERHNRWLLRNAWRLQQAMKPRPPELPA